MDRLKDSQAYTYTLEAAMDQQTYFQAYTYLQYTFRFNCPTEISKRRHGTEGFPSI